MTIEANEPLRATRLPPIHRHWVVLVLLPTLALGLVLSSHSAAETSPTRATSEQSAPPEATTPARDDHAEAIARSANRDLRRSAQTSIDSADALLALGDYGPAIDVLDQAIATARAAKAGAGFMAALHGARGNAYIAVARPEDAAAELALALRLARSAEAKGTLATITNNLGNLHARLGNFDDATAAYLECAEVARAHGDSELVARALANASRVRIEAEDSEGAGRYLLRARREIGSLDSSADKASLLLHWSRSLERFLDRGWASPFPDRPAKLELHAALIAAEEIASEHGAVLSASYAWGYLARLYLDEGRTIDALDLTERAIMLGAETNAQNVRADWHAQAGRILERLGRRDEAITRLAEAVDLLQQIRHAMGISYSGRSESFRESAESIYIDYVDLLLRRAADGTRTNSDTDADLSLAQESLELLKAAELRDYFQDECVDSYRARMSHAALASDTAAVLYPILLRDRLEVIVSHPSGTRRFGIPVARETLEDEIHKFRLLLVRRTTREYLSSAQRLYGWLIEPILPHLTTLGVDTLVFVPGGALRTVPMAALHDGSKFLIERYAVAVTPGLELTDPKPLDLATSRLFAGGVSAAVQGHDALPHVPSELRQISSAIEGEVLLDESFERTEIERALGNTAFNILHIASHASFDPDANQTYVLAYDAKISMDDLANYVGLFRFREQPLDLLFLSACDTAAGDERAALGLAGVAIRAGARSAIGTLWSVNDEATSRLVVEFYAQLGKPGTSRAKALQRAQRVLLTDPIQKHPAFWSPFLLISNWL